MKKSRLWILFIIAFCLTAYIIIDTFALFESNLNESTSVPIGKWSIKLNNNDITNGTTVEFPIENFTTNENNHTTTGYFGPGSSGYFDVVLDPGDTDVSIRYDITLDIAEDLPGNISYFLSVDGNAMTRTDEFTYSGVLDIADIDNGVTPTLRINIVWNDIGSYNESDTNLGIVYNNNITIPVRVHVIQYLGEQIIPYDENETITFLSRSNPNGVTVGDVISIRNYGNFYVTYTNNSITRIFPYYNLNIGPNKLSSIRDYAQDARLIHDNGQNVFSTSDYWTGHIGTDYSGNNNGNPYPYVFDNNSSLYSYTLDYRNILSSLGLTGVTVRLQTYEEAESLLNSNSSLVCASTYWLGSSRWGSIFILESASTCELKAVSYSAASGRGFRPIIEFATDSLL
jgi:hypothetical protein